MRIQLLASALVVIGCVLLGVSGWGWVWLTAGSICLFGGTFLRSRMSHVLDALEAAAQESTGAASKHRRQLLTQGLAAGLLPLVGCALVVIAHLV